MLNITVTKTAARNGSGNLVAKGAGKQRTTKWDHSKSIEANFGAAAGALLNVLVNDQQRAKIKHPSGGQRVRVEHLSDNGGKRRFSIDV